MSNTNQGDKPTITQGEYLTNDKTVYVLQNVEGKFDKGVQRKENRIYAGVQGHLASDSEKIAVTKMFATAGNLTQKYSSLEILESRMIEAEKRVKELEEVLQIGKVTIKQILTPKQ